MGQNYMAGLENFSVRYIEKFSSPICLLCSDATHIKMIFFYYSYSSQISIDVFGFSVLVNVSNVYSIMETYTIGNKQQCNKFIV